MKSVPRWAGKWCAQRHESGKPGKEESFPASVSWRYGAVVLVAPGAKGFFEPGLGS